MKALDRKLARDLWAMKTQVVSIALVIACGIGAFINIALAEWLFVKSLPYWAAGLAGALIASLWNFFTTASFTWGGSTARKR